MKVSILTIGDEILIGQVIDTNSAWMGQRLNAIGAEVEKTVSVKDTRASIEDGLRVAAEGVDIVLMTGGLGPTKDDITKKVLADYFGTKMYFHEPTWERIQKLFARWGRSTTPAHREQCFMPESATILMNKMGTAPGMWFEHDEKVFVSMPGVPYEMKFLMENEVLPRLQANYQSEAIAHRTILTIGEGESRIAKRIEAFDESLPKNIKIAYLPNLGRVRVRLTGRGGEQADLEALLDKKKEELVQIIPELVYGFEKEQLEEVLGKMLLDKGWTLATAESCTGGHIGHKIISIPGSSAYYTGGVVAYSNTIKNQLLHVSQNTLNEHGAVSEQTVTEMVQGALKTLGSDVALSISGIAGPGGGTPEKPVGTVWMAVGNQDKIITRKLSIGKNRAKNIEYSAVQALNLLRQFLLQE